MNRALRPILASMGLVLSLPVSVAAQGAAGGREERVDPAGEHTEPTDTEPPDGARQDEAGGDAEISPQQTPDGLADEPASTTTTNAAVEGADEALDPGDPEFQRPQASQPTTHGDAQRTPSAALPAPVQEVAAGPDPGRQGLRERLHYTLGAELVYLQVAGKGGFSNRNPDPISPDTPGGQVFIDRATLDVTADLNSWMYARVRFRADPDAGYTDRAYLQAEPWPEHLTLQLGYNKPYHRVGRRTESYGIVQTAYWRSRQIHFAADFTPHFGPVTFRLSPTVQTQRGQGDKYTTKDEALASFAFANARVGESNPMEYGGLASVSALGASVGGFGYVGQLRDNEDLLYLERLFDRYEEAGNVYDRTTYWYGVRGGFERFGLWLHADVILNSKQGLVERSGFELAGSYTVGWDVAQTHMELEPIVRHSALDVNTFAPDYQIPQTWDRTQTLLGVMFRPLTTLQFNVEYLLHGERPGVSQEGKTEIDNDELLFLLEFEVSDETL